MSWVNLDDGFPDHRKIAGLSDAAFRLHVAGIAYCNRGRTDGHIPADDVPRLVRRFRRSAVTELVKEGIWVDVMDAGTDYMLHDYLDWNESRQRIEDKAKSAADRRARYINKNGDSAA